MNLTYLNVRSVKATLVSSVEWVLKMALLILEFIPVELLRPGTKHWRMPSLLVLDFFDFLFGGNLSLYFKSTCCSTYKSVNI